MGQKLANNARATLASGIGAADTSLTVSAPHADLFPVANTGTASVPAATDWFKATLENASGQCEIIYVRTRTAGSALFANVLRGQEGTTARAYPANSVVGVRVTALDLQNALGVLAGDSTFTGSNTFAQQVLMSAGVKLGPWTVTEAAGSLLFAHNGANKMKLDSSGNLTLAGTVYIDGAP